MKVAVSKGGMCGGTLQSKQMRLRGNTKFQFKLNGSNENIVEDSNMVQKQRKNVKGYKIYIGDCDVTLLHKFFYTAFHNWALLTITKHQL